jgi:RNA polymerase sigma-70 factor (ECF subfamily)
MKHKKQILDSAYNDYNKALNSYAFFKVHNRELSKDLVQDTFIKTWSYLVKTGKIDTMKAFLYHVLNNLIIDEYRKNKPVSLDNLTEKGFEPIAQESECLFDKIDGKTAILLIKIYLKLIKK